MGTYWIVLTVIGDDAEDCPAVCGLGSSSSTGGFSGFSYVVPTSFVYGNDLASEAELISKLIPSLPVSIEINQAHEYMIAATVSSISNGQLYQAYGLTSHVNKWRDK